MIRNNVDCFGSASFQSDEFRIIQKILLNVIYDTKALQKMSA